MYETYNVLIRPDWAPPAWIFGPVWTVLYIIIAISFGAVFIFALRNKVAKAVALPFVLNLVFNFAFTPIQFGLENYLLASVDIVLVWGTIVWAFLSLWKYKNLRWIIWVNIPYFLWVSFATVLQITITVINF